jgi:uncharacterized membrane protein
MIFDFFKKRMEKNKAKIREAEERILAADRIRREDARRIVESHNRSRSTYSDSSYTPSTYSSYDSSSYSDSSSSSCDSGGGGGGGGCD